MKFNPTIFSKNIGRTTVLFAALGIVFSFSSCKKDHDVQPPQEISALSIINASPTAGTLDFFLDDQKTNYTGITYGGNELSYLRAFPGVRNGKIRVENDSKTLYSANFELTKGKYHSLFIVTNPDSTSFLLVKDEFKEPAAGKAQVRFANLSSDSPAYNLEFEGDTTTFNDRTFRAFTDYKDVAAKTYKLILKNKTSGATVTTLEDVELKEGNIYTIWAKGLVNTTVEAQKLGIQVSLYK